MRKIWSWVACVVAVACALANTSDVQARPGYLKGFNAEYPALKAPAEEAKCGICHFGKEKKDRNDFGKALREALGGDKVPKAGIADADAIKAALKKVEAGKSSTEGKTFGDLIKDGKLPGKNP